MNFPKALTTSMRCIFTSASINVLTLRSGSTWTMYSNKALVGLGFPFGFKLSQSSLETPNLRAKCIQFFIPGVSLSNKIAASSKQFILSRRVTIVWLSVKWENTQQSINQSNSQFIKEPVIQSINQWASENCKRFCKNSLICAVLPNQQWEGGRERRGLGPRNDVLTTCKAVTLHVSQRVIGVFPTLNILISQKRTSRRND